LRRAEAQAVEEQPDHPVALVEPVVGRAGHAQAADGDEQLSGVDVGPDLAGRGCAVEQRLQRRPEPPGEVSRQGVVRGVAGVQRSGQPALGGDEAMDSPASAQA